MTEAMTPYTHTDEGALIKSQEQKMEKLVELVELYHELLQVLYGDFNISDSPAAKEIYKLRKELGLK